MQLSLKLDIPPLPRPITYADDIMLIGSCFTEHMADRLAQHKFRVVANPNGILFNPLSVAQSLDSYIAGRQYREEELFYLNELWNSWDHHTFFSDTDASRAVLKINASQRQATTGIARAGWLIITLGSAFQYHLKENGRAVANNHRAPAGWFEKKLLSISEITTALSDTLQRLLALNPRINVLFTISPVRHIRDGVIENNKSKARLIESVHELCSRFSNAFYFPAYELLIDILRDYRFYDIDFVHPNFLATSYIWEEFVKSCIAADDQRLMEQVKEISVAAAHKPRFPETAAHKKFRETYCAKIKSLLQQHPFLMFENEIEYFSNIK